MDIGLEKRSVALVGLSKSDAEGMVCGVVGAGVDYFKGKGVGVVISLDEMPDSYVLRDYDGVVVHLTHEENEIGRWVREVVKLRDMGVYTVVVLYILDGLDQQAKISLTKQGIKTWSTKAYYQAYHDILDHLKMMVKE